MRKVFLTSHLKNYRGGRCVLHGTPLFDGNGLAEQIRSLLPGLGSCVFASASETDHVGNDEQASTSFEAFRLSGMTFERYLVLDGRTLHRADEARGADLVLLAGGEPREEMDFYEKAGLRSLLDIDRSVIVGVSAGSLNAAENVFSSPESIGVPERAVRYRGLGLTDVNIEPHFKCSEPRDSDGVHQRKELLEESMRRPLYALPNGSHIFDDGRQRILYGEGYRVSGGSITLLCDDGQSALL